MLTRNFLTGLISAALAVPAAGSAQALSCMQPDVGSSFQAAHDGPAQYLVALGSLARVGENIPDGPDTGNMNEAVGYAFPARFDGHFATTDGFDVPRGVDVTVEVSCVGPWCGGDSLSDHGLYFFRSDAAGDYAFEAGPCRQFFFDDPIEHQLMEVIGLME